APRVRARAEVARLERVHESLERLAVGMLEQVVLALPDLNQPAQLARTLRRLLALERTLQRRDPDQSFERREQTDRIERLAGERVRAGGQRAYAGLLRAADRDDRDRPRLRALAEPLAVERPVHAGKADVEHDGVGARFGEQPLRLDHMVRLVHLDALELERRPEQLAERQIVVDDQ